MINASEFMRADLVPLTPRDSAWSALALMRTHDVRSMLVVDGERLVGVLSMRSFSTILEWTRPDGTLRGILDVRVDQIMTPRRDLHPVRRDTPLREVARLLAEERLDCVPVLDDAERPVGILRYRDVIRGLLAINDRLEARGHELFNVRVLVVEDDQDSRELLRWALESHGASVVVADSAEMALEMFSRDQPQVVVSDLSMPRYDGYWLIGQIRARRLETPIAAVAVTGCDDAFDRQGALAAGFDDHLVKPIDTLHLCRAVASAVGRSSSGSIPNRG